MKADVNCCAISRTKLIWKGSKSRSKKGVGSIGRPDHGAQEGDAAADGEGNTEDTLVLFSHTGHWRGETREGEGAKGALRVRIRRRWWTLSPSGCAPPAVTSRHRAATSHRRLAASRAARSPHARARPRLLSAGLFSTWAFLRLGLAAKSSRSAGHIYRTVAYTSRS